MFVLDVSFASWTARFHCPSFKRPWHVGFVDAGILGSDSGPAKQVKESW